MKTKKPDAAERLADKYAIVLRTYCANEFQGNKAVQKLKRRIRSLIRREVKAERERMIALAEAQRHYELVHHLTRAGAFALDDLIRTMKGPK